MDERELGERRPLHEEELGLPAALQEMAGAGRVGPRGAHDPGRVVARARHDAQVAAERRLGRAEVALRRRVGELPAGPAAVEREALDRERRRVEEHVVEVEAGVDGEELLVRPVAVERARRRCRGPCCR
jgi:hypothetical protein